MSKNKIISPETKALIRQFIFFRMLMIVSGVVVCSVALAVLGFGFYASLIIFVVCAGVLELRDIQFASYRNILKKECNPQKYADFYNELAKIMHNHNDVMRCYFEVATGLYYIGDAHATLNYIGTHLPEASVYLPDKPAYYNLIANCYYQLGNRQMMELTKRKVKDIITFKPPKSVVEGINYSLVNIDLCLAFLDGSTEKVKQLLGIIYSPNPKNPSSMPPYQSVAMSYSYGMLALEEGNFSQAKELFNFVIQNGKTLYYVNNAKSFIEQIEQS